MKSKNKLFIYSCDSAHYRGEGILANSFKDILKKIFKDFKITFYTPEHNFFYFKKNNLKKKLNHSFFYKYCAPLWGIFKVWQYHLKGNKTAYLNFLPLWNIFLFLFLPQKTILGPITGGSYHGNNLNIKTLFRKKIIFTLYFLSTLIIRIRKFKCIFSSSLLLNYLPNNIKKKSIFNFQLYNFSFLKREKKTIDIIYYNRNYYTKNNNKIISVLSKLKDKHKILILGHEVKTFQNLGIVSRNEVINLLKKTRFVFSSPENPMSYFVLDAIRCNVKIISTSSLKPSYFKEFFVYAKKLNTINIKKIIFSKNKNFKRKKYLQKLKTYNTRVKNFIENNYAS